MTFIQWEFLVLFLVVYVTYWATPRSIQSWILIISSAVFYGWVHPWFLILMYGSSVLDYTVGIMMERQPEHKKRWLWVSMVGNLGMLGYFKYCNFFIENVITALQTMGVQSNLTTLEIFLPVGISFYTFQTMSYSIDVYRGDLQARKHFLDYMVFVSFFPQLVAGPVERATNLLLQVEKPRTWNFEQQRSGMTLAMWGAFKKVCIADTIAPYVDKILIVDDPSWGMVAMATIGFSIQILADFAGYTDIARGTARMLGFELMQNFAHPYLATNPSEFWKRWHISFSSWIRDYIYISVGGNRGGFWGATRSAFIAMGISGLWHGASWNFVIWGLYHAALLTGYRLITPRIPASVRNAPWSTPVAVVIMYFWTCVGWLIFRETHFDRLVHYFTLVPWQSTPDQTVVTAVMAGLCLLCAAPLVIAVALEKKAIELSERPSFLPAETTFWAACLIAVLTMMREQGGDFIYFQF